MSWEKYRAFVACHRFHIAIAPALDTAFNRSRSLSRLHDHAAYGAAGLFMMARAGQLDALQLLVSLVVITLFVPCIANVLVIAKEHGWKTMVGVVAVVFPLAFAVGAVLNAALRFGGWPLW